MAIVAVIMVVGFSAFKVGEMTKVAGVSKVYTSWYFMGGDETNPSHYTDDESQAPDCVGTQEIICEILAPEDLVSGGPDLNAPSDPNDVNSDKVEDLIIDARDNPGNSNASVLSFRQL